MNKPSFSFALPSFSVVNIRNTVRAHLFRERFEVLLAVLIPFLFMAESGYACAWILVDGHLGLDAPSVMAFARGFAIEAFVFVCFKLVHIFWKRGTGWARLTIVFPLLIGLVAVVVSSGMNLGWMIQSPEMRAVMGMIGAYMPDVMTNIFRLGLGLLFPVGVALFALFDVRHLIDEVIASSHLDDRAMLIQRSEMHRGLYLKSLKRAKNSVASEYDGIALADAQNMVSAVRTGDLSFGAGAARNMTGGSSSVTQVSQVNPTIGHSQRALPAPGGQQPPLMPPLSSMPKQPPINSVPQPHP